VSDFLSRARHVAAYLLDAERSRDKAVEVEAPVGFGKTLGAAMYAMRRRRTVYYLGPNHLTTSTFVGYCLAEVARARASGEELPDKGVTYQVGVERVCRAPEHMARYRSAGLPTWAACTTCPLRVGGTRMGAIASAIRRAYGLPAPNPPEEAREAAARAVGLLEVQLLRAPEAVFKRVVEACEQYSPRGRLTRDMDCSSLSPIEDTVADAFGGDRPCPYPFYMYARPLVRGQVVATVHAVLGEPVSRYTYPLQGVYKTWEGGKTVRLRPMVVIDEYDLFVITPDYFPDLSGVDLPAQLREEEKFFEKLAARAEARGDRARAARYRAIQGWIGRLSDAENLVKVQVVFDPTALMAYLTSRRSVSAIVRPPVVAQARVLKAFESLSLEEGAREEYTTMFSRPVAPVMARYLYSRVWEVRIPPTGRGLDLLVKVVGGRPRAATYTHRAAMFKAKEFFPGYRLAGLSATTVRNSPFLFHQIEGGRGGSIGPGWQGNEVLGEKLSRYKDFKGFVPRDRATLIPLPYGPLTGEKAMVSAHAYAIQARDAALDAGSCLLIAQSKRAAALLLYALYWAVEDLCGKGCYSTLNPPSSSPAHMAISRVVSLKLDMASEGLKTLRTALSREPKGYVEVKVEDPAKGDRGVVYLLWLGSVASRGVSIPAKRVVVAGTGLMAPTTWTPLRPKTDTEDYGYEKGSKVVVKTKWGGYLTHSGADVFFSVSAMIQAIGRSLRDVLWSPTHRVLPIAVPEYVAPRMGAFAPIWLAEVVRELRMLMA